MHFSFVDSFVFVPFSRFVLRRYRVCSSPLSVSVFSGFLGAGKSSLILSVLDQLSAAHPSYRCCWLKNEFGSQTVDSRLAAQRNVTGVKELLNGCICCTQVGQLGDAISELIAEYAPDRILIETSGASLPAPLAWELRRLAAGSASQPPLPIELDALVCVVDAANFRGYADKSYTARAQAKYTDIIVVNKAEVRTGNRG